MTITKKFEPEKEQKVLLWKTKKFFGLIGFIFLILIIAEIWVANTLANFGERFEKLNELQVALKQENQILENDIASFSSIQNIASASSKLGLTSSKSVKYIR